MANYSTDLMEYYPQHIRNMREMRILSEEADEKIDDIWDAVSEAERNSFIESADEYGIGKYEELLGIIPLESDGLEMRRERIRAYWLATIPFTYNTMVTRLGILVGSGNFTVYMDYGKYELALRLKYGAQDKVTLVLDFLKRILPANILLLPSVYEEYGTETESYAGIRTTVTRITEFTITAERTAEYSTESRIYAGVQSNMEMATDLTILAGESIGYRLEAPAYIGFPAAVHVVNNV